MKKKTKKKAGSKTDPVKTKSPDEPAADVEKTFDFGGLPKRDLKKNLGC